MKIGRLHIYWQRENNQIIKIPRKLSRLDEERIRKYLAGDHHIHRNPSRKKKIQVEQLSAPIDQVV